MPQLKNPKQIALWEHLLHLLFMGTLPFFQTIRIKDGSTLIVTFYSDILWKFKGLYLFIDR